jgi:hypothetical protein
MSKNPLTSPPKLDKNTHMDEHSINTEVGSLIFAQADTFDETKSKTIKSDSYIEVSNNEKVQSKLKIHAGGQVLLQSADSLSLNVGNNIDISVKGNKQEAIAGDVRSMKKGDHVHLDGAHTKEQQDAANQIYQSHARIQEARMQAMDTKGQMVACPVCSNEHAVDTKSDTIDALFAWLRKILPPFFCFPFDTLQYVLHVLISPFLSIVQNIGLSGPSGCGSSGCKNGQVESPVEKMKAADKATANAIKQESENLTKNAKILSGGNKAQQIGGDVVYKIGYKKNDLPAYKNLGVTVPYGFCWKPSRTQSGNLYMSSEGTADTISFNQPQVHENGGSVLLDVANKFQINVGSPGIDVLTSGRFTVQSGDVVITATQGEAVFGSGNKTTIKGQNVFIDADDKSGKSGFGIQAKHTMVGGSFNVRGDAAFKGHLTTDGSISTPHLIVPSMRGKVTVGSTSKFTTEKAEWQYGGKALHISNLVKDITLKYNPANGTDYSKTLTALINLTAEYYNEIMLSIPVEPTITGICVVAGFGASTGIVLNFPHVHQLWGHDHFHEYTSPKASYWNDRHGWGQERMAGSPIPTPAAAMGDNLSPGPDSKPGGCGGGGLYTRNRNENYGLDPLNPSGGLDWIPLDIQRKPDGTLTPTPRTSLIYGISGYPFTPPPWNGNVGTTPLSSAAC